eukprot:5166314-Ditylum_brightwellii.AAC.1
MALMIENTRRLKAQLRDYTLWHAGHITTTTFPLSPLLSLQPQYSYATAWLLCREGPGPLSKTAS